MACIEISGNNLVACADSNIYRIEAKIWNEGTLEYDPAIVLEDTYIYISYAGSTLEYNNHFIGEKTLIIKKDTGYIDFEIKTYSDMDGKIIISTESELGSCNNYEINVECEEIRSQLISTCCDFVPKDFLSWRDGAAQNLIAPNKR